MKKKYIEPKTTVVALNINSNLMQASNATLDSTQSITNSSNFGAREVIQQDIKSPDAWEMWE